MQSDAFPTPPIYSQHFQPRLVNSIHRFGGEDLQQIQPTLEHLLNEIELLVSECSDEESKYFWLATDRLKVKHQVIEAMQKVEQLFLDLASYTSPDPELITSVSEGLLYTQALHKRLT
ncbi:MAG: hypothetical protein NW214_14755 [Pseudanabaenaceae cyanobacterium bins.39]|nr:hypothetical protein [Pseudanabaenaceae cyanobacterium bins.39]